MFIIFQGTGSYVWALPNNLRPLSFARLKSPQFQTEGLGRRCIIFYYNMHGPAVESLYLNVVDKANGQRKVIWSRNLDQGKGWKKVHF